MHKKITSTYWYRLSWRALGGRSNDSHADLHEIQQIAVFLQSVKSETKLTIFQNWGYFYCNNKELAYTLSEFTGVHHNNTIKEILVNRPRNTVQLNESEYCYRTYFRNRKVSEDKKYQISEFLKLQPEIAMSPSLTKWCNTTIRRWSSFYTERHYFIDHTDLGIILMLQIIDPTVIRKTVDITVVNNRETNNGKNKRRSSSN
jgi:hypothetical protein